jgi:hypothetical protein
MYHPAITELLAQARVDELRRAAQPGSRQRTDGAAERKIRHLSATLSSYLTRPIRTVSVDGQRS